jgi:cytochrome P450
MITIVNADYAHIVLKSNASKGEGLSLQFETLMGENVVTANGDSWKRQRKIVGPAFKGFSRHEDVIRKHADVLIELIGIHESKPVVINDLIQRFNIDTISDDTTCVGS